MCQVKFLKMFGSRVIFCITTIVKVVHTVGVLEVAPTDDDEMYIRSINENATEPELFDPKLLIMASRRQDHDNIKSKINLLMKQSLKIAESKVRSILYYRNLYKKTPAFKVGYVLMMVKKAMEVVNDVFNVAVKHRADWTALEQLRAFELITHTCSDTQDLVRKLIDIHVRETGKTKPPQVAHLIPSEEEPPDETPENVDVTRTPVLFKRTQVPLIPRLFF